MYLFYKQKESFPRQNASSSSLQKNILLLMSEFLVLYDYKLSRSIIDWQRNEVIRFYKSEKVLALGDCCFAFDHSFLVSEEKEGRLIIGSEIKTNFFWQK